MISGSAVLGRTCTPAPRPSLFRKWRLTAAGMTWRSATSTPVDVIPETTARFSSRLAGAPSRLVTTLTPRFRAVPSAIPIRSAVSGVRSTFTRPETASRPKRREGEPRLPDQVSVDERAGLDLLERVDADARHDDALLADRAAVPDGDTLVQTGVRPDVAGLPDDRALHERAAAEVRRGVDNGARRARVLAQGHARREDGVRADRRLRREAAVVADQRRLMDLRSANSTPSPTHTLPRSLIPATFSATFSSRASKFACLNWSRLPMSCQ